MTGGGARGITEEISTRDIVDQITQNSENNGNSEYGGAMHDPNPNPSPTLRPSLALHLVLA